MPAYNAGRTLRMTYEELPKDAVSMVILVDDGSTDATLEIARQLGLEIFVHNRNYGYGANQKTCYAEALRAGADVVVRVHPDYQYDPRLVPQIIEPIPPREADVVPGPPPAPAASTASVAATRASRRRSASRPARALDDPPPLDDHRASLGRPTRRGARAPPAGHLPWRWAPGPRYKETRHGGARGDEASGHDPRDPRPRPRGRLLCGRPADGRVEARPHRPRARR